MRIIVNAISANTGGIVTYTGNLVRHLGTEDFEIIIYVPLTFDDSVLPARDGVSLVKVNNKFMLGLLGRLYWEQVTWRRIIKRSGADVLFSSANYGVLFAPIPQVLLVQGEIYLNTVYRERVLPRLGCFERLSAYLRRKLVLWSARSSRRVVFPSLTHLEASADYDPMLADNAEVNFLAVENRFGARERTRPWRDDDCLRMLYVSVYYPHKDPGTLARATVVLNEAGFKAESHITMEHNDFVIWANGEEDWAGLNEPSMKGCVSLGRIPHEQLIERLDTFDLFVFPSAAETFGFPMVEAMAAGIPLLVSDTQAHREICGDAAAYYELGNAQDLADQARALDADPDRRRDMVALGKVRAADMFTWSGHMEKLAKTLKAAGAPAGTRVLINALHARSGGGVTYLRNILPALAREEGVTLYLILNEDQRGLLPSGLENVHFLYQRFTRGFWRTLFLEQVMVPLIALHVDADVTFSPANFGPVMARRSMVMVRNATSVAAVERRPLKLAYWTLLHLATLLSLMASRRAIAVSDYARKQVARGMFTYLRRRIAVVHHGVNAAFAPPPAGVPREGFLLAVSDLYVQKNFVNLLTAFAALRVNHPDVVLRIAGAPIDQEYFGWLQRMVVDLGLSDHVEFLGHIQFEELRSLYHRCAVFVFPSSVETFGHPLVEAMASGAPIASSNGAAMPEILGDAGVYFDPHDPGDMVRAIGALLDDAAERERLGRAAEARARNYSWARSASETLAVFKDASLR